jgi:hypothetical protein
MHKYRVGDTVAYVPVNRFQVKPPAGAYKIVFRMPWEDNQDEAAYRIKSGTFERVARECELTLC